MEQIDQSSEKQIREDRKQGFSLRQLEAKYGISRVTISRWVRDIKSTNTNFERYRESESEHKAVFREDGKVKKLNPETCRLLLAILYWCEGSKPPSSNFIAFSNSDPQLVKAFLFLLRKSFDIDESKLKVHLQVHDSQNYQQLVEFWQQHLEIEKGNFYKPTITTPNNKRRRLNYQGTCTIKYFDVKLLYQIVGIYEAFGNLYGGVAKWSTAEVC